MWWPCRAELPDDGDWATHDWRWNHRYEEAEARAVTEGEREAKLAEQLKNMAAAPVRRKRR